MNRRSPAAALVDGALEATVVGSFTRIGFAARNRLEHWTDPPAAAGRTIVVTGATSGLGLAAARRLAALGANVSLVGRSQSRIDAAVADVRREARGSVDGYRCDLSLVGDTLGLAQRLADGIDSLDVLIHNAGALLARYTPTVEGVETTLATHLLNPYLLTERLITSGSLTPAARVIMMTSGGLYTERFDLDHLEMDEHSYRGPVAYARAKRAQTVMMAHWQSTYAGRGLGFHLVHPGWARTPGIDEGLPGFSRVMAPLLRNADQGADTLVWLAGQPDGEPTPGRLWLDRHPRPLHRLRRTRLTPNVEAAAEAALPKWCDERITRVRDSGGQ